MIAKNRYIYIQEIPKYSEYFALMVFSGTANTELETHWENLLRISLQFFPVAI